MTTDNFRIVNDTDNDIRIRLIAKSVDSVSTLDVGDNLTHVREPDGSFQMCLAGGCVPSEYTFQDAVKFDVPPLTAYVALVYKAEGDSEFNIMSRNIESLLLPPEVGANLIDPYYALEELVYSSDIMGIRMWGAGNGDLCNVYSTSRIVYLAQSEFTTWTTYSGSYGPTISLTVSVDGVLHELTTPVNVPSQGSTTSDVILAIKQVYEDLATQLRLLGIEVTLIQDGHYYQMVGTPSEQVWRMHLSCDPRVIPDNPIVASSTFIAGTSMRWEVDYGLNECLEFSNPETAMANYSLTLGGISRSEGAGDLISKRWILHRGNEDLDSDTVNILDYFPGTQDITVKTCALYSQEET